MIHSVIRLQESDKGFQTDHILTMRVPVGTMRGPRPTGKKTMGQLVFYYQELAERIERTPRIRKERSHSCCWWARAS